MTQVWWFTKKTMPQINVHGSKYGESLKKSWHKLLCMIQSIVSHWKSHVTNYLHVESHGESYEM
jgi:uncharacterized protein YpbB